MARLNAVANALYYPTPLRVVAGIARLLCLASDDPRSPHTPGHNALYTVLDHSCGTGEAVAFLAFLLTQREVTNAKGSPHSPTVVNVWGIELDRLRADAARTRLAGVVNGSALSAQVPPGRVSLLWSNPPYDHTDAADGVGRLEHTFLRRYTLALQEGGILVHIIGLNQIAASVSFLARNYRELQVYAFPQPEYQQFRQVIILGVRQSHAVPETESVAQLRAVAEGVAEPPPLPCPSATVLSALVSAWGNAGSAWERECAGHAHGALRGDPAYDRSGPIYGIPPDSQPKEFSIRSTLFTPSDALHEAAQSGVWANRAFRDTVLPAARGITARPLLPLRDEQAALLVSVGLLNNMLLTDGTARVLVKGALHKAYVPIEAKTNERGSVTHLREREVIRAHLTRLDLATGDIAIIAPEETHAFIQRFRPSIRQQMADAYPPLYTPGQPATDATIRHLESGIARLGRPPKGAQRQAIIATALSLLRQRGTFVSAEAGSGKTHISLSASYLSGMRRVIVACPPHLVRKWAREVVLSVRGALACIVTTPSDLDAACTHMRASPARFTVVIVSRERLKLSHRWRPAALWQRPRDCADALHVPYCPCCALPLTDGDDAPLTHADLERKKMRCPKCGEALWQGIPQPRRVAVAEYLKKKWRGFFELCIIDEAHEAKGADSAQGLACATLAECCERTLALTGTLGGGYSSDLFPLLWRFGRAIRASYDRTDSHRFAQTFGIIERITRTTEDGEDQTIREGVMSDSRTTRAAVQYIERPGINPAVLLHLIPNTVFLRLSDVTTDLPPYAEHILTLPLDATPDPALSTDTRQISHASAYSHLATDLYAEVRAQLARGSSRLLGKLVQSLLGWPDNPTVPEEVVAPPAGRYIASAPALSSDHLYPKEAALVALYRREHAQHRKMIVFVTNTETRDITPRLKTILEDTGARVAVLKSSSVSADKREAWLADQVRRGVDVVLVHPKAVETGLDLLDFPTLLFYQLTYSVYTLRQASRRSWRIGQKRAIHVYHFAYEGTLQEQALYHIARKAQASQLIEGDLGGDGLVALADAEGESSSLMLTLARAIARSSEAIAEPTTTEAGWHSLTLADLEPLSRPEDAAVPAPPETPAARTPPTLEELRVRLAASPKSRAARPTRITAPVDTRQLDLFSLFDAG